MLGLDNAGKTSILYTLRFGTEVTTRTTIGYNVESIVYKNTEFTVIDVGGTEQIRPLWKHYYDGVDGIIFVVDSNDESRFKEARVALNNVLNDSLLKNAILIVFSNKSDLPKAKSAKEIDEMLLLPNSGRVYNVIGTSILRGDGLVEGFSWLEQTLNNLEKSIPKK